jgi:hypothetical protein
MLRIHLTGDNTFTEEIREAIKSKINRRYKLSLIAEDIGVSYMQLWRFMKGEKVSEDFINKAVKFLIS